MLKDHVDGSAVFSVTSYINLVAQGIHPDKDIRWFRTTATTAWRCTASAAGDAAHPERPQPVAGLVRAFRKGQPDTSPTPMRPSPRS